MVKVAFYLIEFTNPRNDWEIEIKLNPKFDCMYCICIYVCVRHKKSASYVMYVYCICMYVCESQEKCMLCYVCDQNENYMLSTLSSN